MRISSWQLILIDPEHCPEDEALKEVIENYNTITQSKYNRILTHFPECYTHPVRNRETKVGKIFADAFKKSLDLDIMLEASGSLRSQHLEPIMTVKNLQEMHCLPHKPQFANTRYHKKAVRVIIDRDCFFA